MAADSRLIGLLGGTFDPVHYGHLRLAIELQEQLELDEVRLLPCGKPAHRSQPTASALHRLHMVQLALEGQSHLRVDDAEVSRPGLTYTVDTLKQLYAASPSHHHFCLILGSDAFQNLHQWKDWTALSEFAHFIVVARPGWKNHFEEAMLSWVDRSTVSSRQALLKSRAGGVLLVDSVPKLAISSSYVRQQLAKQRSVRYLLPEPVRQYIEAEGLYS